MESDPNESGSGMQVSDLKVWRDLGVQGDGTPEFREIDADPIKCSTFMKHGGILIDSFVHADWVGNSTAIISSVECQSNAFLGT